MTAQQLNLAFQRMQIAADDVPSRTHMIVTVVFSSSGHMQSSRRSSLGRTSVDSYLAHKQDEFHRPSWWAQLDSGRMNDIQSDDRDRAAQVEEAPGKGGSVKIDLMGSNLGQGLSKLQDTRAVDTLGH
jgi:hypothetical protein